MKKRSKKSSLKPTAEERAKIEKAWIEEALRRDAEIESGKVAALPGEDVFRRIRASRR